MFRNFQGLWRSLSDCNRTRTHNHNLLQPLGLESCSSHLIFRFRACFEQKVPWHSGNYREWIYFETRKWHNKNIQMHRADKYSQHSSIVWSIWLNGWVFVYELSGCRFESRCSHLNFIFRACFEQGVPWYSRNYRVRIDSEMRTWNDKNIQSMTKFLHSKGVISSVYSKSLIFYTNKLQ